MTCQATRAVVNNWLHQWPTQLPQRLHMLLLELRSPCRVVMADF